MRTVLGFFASLRLTVALLILSLLLVFAATLDQVHLGVWGVQEKYFHAFAVLGRVPGTALSLPVFPGGWLLGGLLLLNLVAAHASRFRLTWRKSGIWLAHFGLILLLVGEGWSGLVRRDDQMRIDVGQTRNYSESFRETELAVTDVTDPQFDQVVAIPSAWLEERAPIQHPRLPFTIKPLAYFANAALVPAAQAPAPPAATATLGIGTGVVAAPQPLTYKADENNWPAAYVELDGTDGPAGTFLVSALLQEPQEFSLQGRTWRLALRPARDYLPVSLTLLSFTHAVYPGADIPKDFASTVRVKSDDGATDRQVRIFMNNPLRLAGRAFYQAGYANNDHTAILEVVRNPSWRLPYLACALVAAGLAIQFGIHLFGFFGQRGRAPAAAGSGAALAGRPRVVSGLVLGGALVAVAATLLPPRPGPFDLAGFGRLPVLADGRIKPLDTVARTGLLMFQGRQALVAPDGRSLRPEEWLLDVFFRPAEADRYAVFRIDNADLLSLFGLPPGGEAKARFSFAELQPGLQELDRQAQLAEAVDAPLRTAFQRAVIGLREHVAWYESLKYTFQAPEERDFAGLLDDPGRFRAARAEFQTMETFGRVRAVPPAGAGGWSSVGHALAVASIPAEADPHALLFAGWGRAWRGGRPEAFNAGIGQYRRELAARFPGLARKAAFEAFLNRAGPFYTSQVLYVLAFLLSVVSWLRWPEALGSAACRLMALAFILATAGIAARMALEGRPPVTNLYSSALFIGWGAVALCLVLERTHRNGVATAAGGLIGFGTLIIAHHLALSGDTLEMMRAVLDSNFWLATHVVTVTTGYASTFLAGFLAIVYVARGLCTRTLDRATAGSLGRMVYGIVCFATLFSFVGTVLGGIWADQSWGRFWGWDPKENGALIIVIWNAVVLHCRWGGFVRRRGLMALAIFGNVVTAWSWFGTNMLGIGLHSYGFTDAAFYGLIAFVASQLLIIGLAAVPPERWRSPLDA